MKGVTALLVLLFIFSGMFIVFTQNHLWFTKDGVQARTNERLDRLLQDQLEAVIYALPDSIQFDYSFLWVKTGRGDETIPVSAKVIVKVKEPRILLPEMKKMIKTPEELDRVLPAPYQLLGNATEDCFAGQANIYKAWICTASRLGSCACSDVLESDSGFCAEIIGAVTQENKKEISLYYKLQSLQMTFGPHKLPVQITPTCS